MESTLGKNFWFVFLFFAFMIVRLRGEEARNDLVPNPNKDTSLTNAELPQMEKGKGKTRNQVIVNDKRRNNNNGGGGGGVGWGWGGGGGGANQHGGWGWGNGGGGGMYWRWGCGAGKRGQPSHKKTDFPIEDFKIGEFAQCVVKGRCVGMRLDCPLHCGGPCLYDCKNMCKAHCRR